MVSIVVILYYSSYPRFPLHYFVLPLLIHLLDPAIVPASLHPSYCFNFPITVFDIAKPSQIQKYVYGVGTDEQISSTDGSYSEHDCNTNVIGEFIIIVQLFTRNTCSTKLKTELCNNHSRVVRQVHL